MSANPRLTELQKKGRSALSNVIECGRNAKATVIVGASVGMATVASAVPIAAPDMTDAIGSVTNVFGAVLGVAVLIFGFKKIKGLL